MLEDLDTKTIDTSTASGTVSDAPQQSVQELRDLLQRLQCELKFKQTKIDARNFELARLKRWRFRSSSESLDSSTQVVLFDHIVRDTAIEDRAALRRRNPRQHPREPATQSSLRARVDALRLWPGL